LWFQKNKEAHGNDNDGRIDGMLEVANVILEFMREISIWNKFPL
jgi:hypothetical protein